MPTVWPHIPAEEIERRQNEVPVPHQVSYAEARTGTMLEPAALGRKELQEAHFGIPTPPNGVVGHYDDPAALPTEKVEILRHRLFSAMDVLLPLFAEENRPWTDEANKAAQEVRDFFPLAAEPGLWPYYKAEGREFFAWVEKNAPSGKAPLPWEEPGR